MYKCIYIYICLFIHINIYSEYRCIYRYASREKKRGPTIPTNLKQIVSTRIDHTSGMFGGIFFLNKCQHLLKNHVPI